MFVSVKSGMKLINSMASTLSHYQSALETFHNSIGSLYKWYVILQSIVGWKFKGFFAGRVGASDDAY